MDLTGIGSVANFAKSVVERIFPPKMSEAEKATAQIALQEMLDKRESDVLETQRAVMVAEMNQGDAFTKRARPMIVYFGLAAIGLVHVLLPIVAWIFLTATGTSLDNMPDIQLPAQFWTVWGGVCSIWIISRGMEKRGASGVAGQIAGLITGSR